jgi:predicted TIM-barrel fold metal-dependent hydrolase
MTEALRLIDADAHVNPPADFWNAYLPERFKGRAPKIVPGSNTEKHDWVEFEGTRKPLSFMASTAGLGREFKTTGRVEELRVGGWTPKARLTDMDQDGVDTAVIFGGGPLGTTDPELFVESFKAYNHWVADFCDYDRKRLAGVAYLPMMDIDESITMLKDAAKRGLKAVNIPAFPMSKPTDAGNGGFANQVLALTGDPNGPRQYDDAMFDPFWKAAVDNDIAITIHLGARFAKPNMDRIMTHIVMSKLSMAEPIANMIFGGVFDRFPELRFGSIESQVGWFAWFTQYMDNTWKNQGHWVAKKIKHPPSYYMDKNVYGSFMRDALGVANYNKLGCKNIMWSTDYPHSETTWPNSMEILEQNFAGIPADAKRAIVCDNARKFFAI